jgi:WD40 repeat protein
VVTGSDSGTVAVWDLAGTQRLGQGFRWNTPDQGCPTTPCFVIEPRGTLMAAGQADGTVALIDSRGGRLVRTLPARSGPEVDALAFFADGRRLATGGSNGRVTIWDARTGRALRTLRYPDHVWWVAISPDGRRLAAQTQGLDSADSRVEVRDVASNRVVFAHRVRHGHRGLLFSPDGRLLAAVGCCESGAELRVWDAVTGRPAYRPRLDGRATAIAFSPDGRLLGAGTEDGRVVLWDARDGRPVGAPLRVASGAVDPIAFSPDSALLVASSDDQTATLWDIAARKRQGNSFPVQQSVTPVARFAPDGRLVIVYLSEAAAWPVDLRAWARYACQVAGRSLTQAEWDDVLPARDPPPVCRASR